MCSTHKNTPQGNPWGDYLFKVYIMQVRRRSSTAGLPKLTNSEFVNFDPYTLY